MANRSKAAETAVVWASVRPTDRRRNYCIFGKLKCANDDELGRWLAAHPWLD